MKAARQCPPQGPGWVRVYPPRRLHEVTTSGAVGGFADRPLPPVGQTSRVVGDGADVLAVMKRYFDAQLTRRKQRRQEAVDRFHADLNRALGQDNAGVLAENNMDVRTQIDSILSRAGLALIQPLGVGDDDDDLTESADPQDARFADVGEAVEQIDEIIASVKHAVRSGVSHFRNRLARRRAAAGIRRLRAGKSRYYHVTKRGKGGSVTYKQARKFYRVKGKHIAGKYRAMYGVREGVDETTARDFIRGVNPKGFAKAEAARAAEKAAAKERKHVKAGMRRRLTKLDRTPVRYSESAGPVSEINYSRLVQRMRDSIYSQGRDPSDPKDAKFYRVLDKAKARKIKQQNREDDVRAARDPKFARRRYLRGLPPDAAADWNVDDGVPEGTRQERGSVQLSEISNGGRILGLQLAKRKGGRLYQLDARVADMVGKIDQVLPPGTVAESADLNKDARKLRLSRRDSGYFKEGIDEYTGDADAEELLLYIENDSDLYKQRHMPMIQNLVRKLGSGKYNRDLAVKMFRYLADAGAEKYARDYGPKDVPWHKLFSTNVRNEVAAMLRDDFEAEVRAGSYREFLPKKYANVNIANFLKEDGDAVQNVIEQTRALLEACGRADVFKQKRSGEAHVKRKMPSKWTTTHENTDPINERWAAMSKKGKAATYAKGLNKTDYPKVKESADRALAETQRLLAERNPEGWPGSPAAGGKFFANVGAFASRQKDGEDNLKKKVGGKFSKGAQGLATMTAAESVGTDVLSQFQAAVEAGGIVGGVEVDADTAGAVLAVYEALNDANRKELLAMPVDRIIEVSKALLGE